MTDSRSDRAETAKRHDDSDIVDAAEDGALGPAPRAATASARWDPATT